MLAINNIEEVVLLASIETGVRGDKSAVPLCVVPSDKKRGRIWTKEEEDFIRDNHGHIPEGQIARHLGRTPVSVHLHIEREMHLVSMLKDPTILTAEQVANGLGADSKSVHLLMDTGRMPCRYLPSVKNIRTVNKLIFLKWMLDPENWLYFKPIRVGILFRRNKRGYGDNYDFAFWENARLIMSKACRKWKDCWLTPGQVKHILGIKVSGTRYINKGIHRGTLKAKRWSNWWIKKSDLPHKGKTINYRGEICLKQSLKAGK